MTNLNTLLAQLDQKNDYALYPKVLTDKMIEKFNNTSTYDVHIVDPSESHIGRRDLLELVVRPGKAYGQWHYMAGLPNQSIHIGTYPKMSLSVAQCMASKLHKVMSDCDEYK